MEPSKQTLLPVHSISTKDTSCDTDRLKPLYTLLHITWQTYWRSKHYHNMYDAGLVSQASPSYTLAKERRVWSKAYTILIQDSQNLTVPERMQMRANRLPQLNKSGNPVQDQKI